MGWYKNQKEKAVNGFKEVNRKGRIEGEKYYQKQEDLKFFGNTTQQDMAWGQLKLKWHRQSNLVKVATIIGVGIVIGITILGIIR